MTKDQMISSLARRIVELVQREMGARLEMERRHDRFGVVEMTADIKKLVDQYGPSAAEFSRKYQVDQDTLYRWLDGSRNPSATAATYLRVIERMPDTVADVLRNDEPIASWFEIDDGYPTDVAVDRFVAMEFSLQDADKFLLNDFPKICSVLPCASIDKKSCDPETLHPTPYWRISFSTGGWSGCETLIGAMLGHFWIKHRQWSWRRGGHYQFLVPRAEG